MRNVLDAMKQKLYKGVFIMPETRSMRKRSRTATGDAGTGDAGTGVQESDNQPLQRKGSETRFIPIPVYEAEQQKPGESAAHQIAAGKLKGVFGAGSSSTREESTSSNEGPSKKRLRDTSPVASSSQDAPTLADAVERLTNVELKHRSDALSTNEIDAIKNFIENGILNEQKAKFELEKYESKDIDTPDIGSDIIKSFHADHKGVLITTEDSWYVHSIELDVNRIGISNISHHEGDTFSLSQATFLSWKTRVEASGENMNDIKLSTITGTVDDAEALAAAKLFVEARTSTAPRK